MSTGEDGFVVGRILAAVDATPDSAAVLDIAAQLASEFNAEQNGIFVEDINLLRLAGLPFARELTWSTAMELRLDYQRMERTLRGYAAHAQQAVVKLTTQLKLHASLQVVRGLVAQELLRAAENADLFILGKGGNVRGARIGAIAGQVLQQAQSSVLLVASQIHPYRTVMTIFTDDERSGRVLSAAAHAARAVHKRLLVLIPAAQPSDYQRLRDQARHMLGQGLLLVTYQAVSAMEICFGQNILHDEGIGMMVIDAAQAAANGTEARLAKLACSILLVRQLICR
jgi:nucleotide-binding universal stress UspA family protein